LRNYVEKIPRGNDTNFVLTFMYFRRGKLFFSTKPLILFVDMIVAFRRAWNIAKSGRNIQFWKDNKAATLSMSISEMGWATFRGGSSHHDENEVKRRKPRWLSARPLMPWSLSFSSEFNKNPRASGIELATRRRLAGLYRETLCVSTLFSLFDSISPHFLYHTSRPSAHLSYSPLFITLHFVESFHPSRETCKQISGDACVDRVFREKSKYLLYKY